MGIHVQISKKIHTKIVKIELLVAVFKHSCFLNLLYKSHLRMIVLKKVKNHEVMQR